MHNRHAAAGRRRAVLTAGTTIAALAASALTSVPAFAAEDTENAPVVLDSLAGWDFSQSSTDDSAHWALVDHGLRVSTDATGHRKVAGYFNVDVALADAGEPELGYEIETGIRPGSQLVVDFDNDGTTDGILVGEPVYGNDWWLSNGSKQFAKDAAPSHTGGSGSANHGTLEQWRAAFEDAQVAQFGFSLGSGVTGSGVVRSLAIGGTTYTFAPAPTIAQCTDTTPARISTETAANGWSFGESGTGGHHEYTADGLRVWTTEPQGAQSKSAGYIATDIPLAQLGAPVLEQELTSGAKAGLNLVLSVDGAWNGTLAYEQDIQGGNVENKWWGTRAIPGIPAGPASYQKAWGTLDEILAATYGRHDVRVIGVGYSLGSNAIGDTTVESITAGCKVYAFTTQKQPDVYETLGELHATNLDPQGWVATRNGEAEFVRGGLTLPVSGDWDSSAVDLPYSGTLASIGSVDWEATKSQYLGVHVHTAKGWLSYEKEASYAGKWWSESDTFNVDSGMGYASFASLSDYITQNPGLMVDNVRVLYTNPVAAATTLASVTFGGTKHTFDNPTIPSYIFAAAESVKAGQRAVVQALVMPFSDGVVKVYEGETLLGTGFVDFGFASIDLPALPGGTHNLTAEFTGDGRYVAPSEIDFELSVVKNSPKLTATLPAFKVGTATTTKVIVASQYVTAQGTVEIREGSKVLGSGTLARGITNVTVPALSAGSHTLTVIYLGDANTNAVSFRKTVVVAKATPTVKATVGKTVKAGARPVVTITAVDGKTALTGTATIVTRDSRGKVVSSIPVKVTNGKATYALGKATKRGSFTIQVTFNATTTTNAASTARVGYSVR